MLGWVKLLKRFKKKNFCCCCYYVISESVGISTWYCHTHKKRKPLSITCPFHLRTVVNRSWSICFLACLHPVIFELLMYVKCSWLTVSLVHKQWAKQTAWANGKRERHEVMEEVEFGDGDTTESVLRHEFQLSLNTHWREHIWFPSWTSLASRMTTTSHLDPPPVANRRGMEGDTSLLPLLCYFPSLIGQSDDTFILTGQTVWCWFEHFW